MIYSLNFLKGGLYRGFHRGVVVKGGGPTLLTLGFSRAHFSA